MTIRRTPDMEPPIAIDYDVNAQGNIVALRFHDLSNKQVYSTIPEPGFIHDPDRVQSEYDALVQRDLAYSQAARAVVEEHPDASVFRKDVNGQINIVAVDPTGKTLQLSKNVTDIVSGIGISIVEDAATLDG